MEKKILEDNGVYWGGKGELSYEGGKVTIIFTSLFCLYNLRMKASVAESVTLQEGHVIQMKKYD